MAGAGSELGTSTDPRVLCKQGVLPSAMSCHWVVVAGPTIDSAAVKKEGGKGPSDRAKRVLRRGWFKVAQQRATEAQRETAEAQREAAEARREVVQAQERAEIVEAQAEADRLMAEARTAEAEARTAEERVVVAEAQETAEAAEARAKAAEALAETRAQQLRQMMGTQQQLDERKKEVELLRVEEARRGGPASAASRYSRATPGGWFLADSGR